jgi:rfaE bifunctional protein kinase chain/domain
MLVSQRLPSVERLLALVDAMAGQPVVVAADLVADRFITGSPKRISREAPVLILRYEGERLVPGGGANAVANVAALGGRPVPLGVVGDDESGRGLLAVFEALGVGTAGILVRRGYRTPTKTRILGGGRHSIKQQIVRYDVEDSVELAAADLAAFASTVAAHGGSSRVAIVSDYGYGSACPRLAGLLRQELPSGATIVADSRYRLGEFCGLDGATPNEEEAEALLGRPLGEALADLEASGRALLERLGSRFLLVTRGSRGMSLFDRSATAHLPVHGTDQVADVTGAGDTVIGAFALALAAGASPLEAALLADYAGGVAVMKTGTATVSPAELKQAVASDPLPREELKWGAS